MRHARVHHMLGGHDVGALKRPRGTHLGTERCRMNDFVGAMEGLFDEGGVLQVSKFIAHALVVDGVARFQRS